MLGGVDRVSLMATGKEAAAVRFCNLRWPLVAGRWGRRGRAEHCLERLRRLARLGEVSRL